MRRYPPVEAALRWNGNHLLFSGAARGKPAARLLSYEDLAAQPRDTVARLAREAGVLEPDLGCFVDQHHVQLRPTCSAWGNPSRFVNGLTEVRPDAEWQVRMPRSDRAVVTALTWPLLRKYGYA
jgi:hypothetical protein